MISSIHFTCLFKKELLTMSILFGKHWEGVTIIILSIRPRAGKWILQQFYVCAHNYDIVV